MIFVGKIDIRKILTIQQTAPLFALQRGAGGRVHDCRITYDDPGWGIMTKEKILYSLRSLQDFVFLSL